MTKVFRRKDVSIVLSPLCKKVQPEKYLREFKWNLPGLARMFLVTVIV